VACGHVRRSAADAGCPSSGLDHPEGWELEISADGKGWPAVTPHSTPRVMHTSSFNGKINCFQLDAGEDDNDHFISPE